MLAAPGLCLGGVASRPLALRQADDDVAVALARRLLPKPPRKGLRDLYSQAWNKISLAILASDGRALARSYSARRKAR